MKEEWLWKWTITVSNPPQIKESDDIKKHFNIIEIFWSLQYAIMFHVYVLIENINVLSRNNDKYKKNMKRKFILGAYIGLSFRIADDNEVDQSWRSLHLN